MRQVAEGALRSWEELREQQLRAASGSGKGTVFTSRGFIVVGRTSQMSSLGANPGVEHWSSIDRSQFERLTAQAVSEKKTLVFLLVSIGFPESAWFEVRADQFAWANLPGRDGQRSAFFRVLRRGDRYLLESSGDPIDITAGAHTIHAGAAPAARAALPSFTGIITTDPRVRGGKPCIRGLRITVQDVLEYLASGMSTSQILEEFPDLTEEDVRACLAFAANRERRVWSIPA